jgi:hypothetical protein
VSTPRKRPTAAAWTLAGILITGLLLRLWGIGHGLPVIYNLDEYAHFVVTAVNMFGDGLNPHYFQNPPGFTYLLHALYSVAYGVPPIGSHGVAVHAAFEGDPTKLYLIARVTSALMGIGASWVLYFAGKRLYGTGVALIATALLTFTFLPVHYSHFALNDVPTLLPLCLGLLGLAGIIKRGKLLDYIVAGVGLGLATATKYTAAALAVAIFAAWLIRVWGDREAFRRELVYLLAAGGISVLAFVIANPYALLDPSAFVSGVRRQQRLSAGVSKLGTDDTTGWFYYAKTLTWGFGWIPLLLSLGGAGLALKRDWRKALPFVLFALLVWLFMGKQERFYARWLMPVYPVLAVFAAYAIVELGKLMAEKWRLAATVGIAAVALIQPLISVVHNDHVLTQEDTRDQAKAWLLKNVGKNEKIAIELIGPKPYFNEGGTRGGEPDFDYYPLPSGTEVEKYATTLNSELLNTYAKGGYCYVVVGSIQKGRVTKDPSNAPAGASAYYKALDDPAVATKVKTFSPVKPGSTLPTFNFDISYNWEPLNYQRPGPQIDIYRLKNGDCSGK